jgi:hypothetical protein
MDEGFELPVNFNGKEFMLPAQLHLYGYTQKIEVMVNGISVMYERDEERMWRAIFDAEALDKNRSITVELLQAIASSIEKVLSND